MPSLSSFCAVRETLHALLDDEGGHAARAGRAVRGAHVDDQHVGIRTVGDPHLGAVGDPASPLLLGAAGHRADHVGTGARLAHRQRADPFAAAQLRQVLLLLRLAGVVGDVLHAQVRVRAVGQADRAGGARDFLHRDHVREIAQVRAAVFARHGDAEQAHLAELLPQVGRERVVVVDQVRARRDLRVRERAHGLAQQVDVFAEGKWRMVQEPGWGIRESGIGKGRGGIADCFCDSRFSIPDSRLSYCPRMRPRKRGPWLPMCGSLSLPIALMRSSAMRSAAL